MARQFGNLETQHLHDRMKAEKAPKASKAPGMEHEMGAEESPEEIAAAHGPAHEVHITHDEEMGEHHVHSKHPDGHVHKSKHADRNAAHSHGMKLAGAAEHEAAEDKAASLLEDAGHGKEPDWQSAMGAAAE